MGEEGVETALAATVNDREELTNEAADLMYHLMVLLQDQNLDLTAIIKRLKNAISNWLKGNYFMIAALTFFSRHCFSL